jgi:hypothetical protein
MVSRMCSMNMPYSYLGTESIAFCVLTVTAILFGAGGSVCAETGSVEHIKSAAASTFIYVSDVKVCL